MNFTCSKRDLAWIAPVSFIVPGFLIVFFSFADATPPSRIHYQGRLTNDAGDPLTGRQTLFFSLWRGGTADGTVSGTKSYGERAAVTPSSQGTFEHQIGTGTVLTGQLNEDIFDTDLAVYVQVAVGTEKNVLLPRSLVTSVGYAFVASNVVGDITPRSVSIKNIGTVIDRSGQWVGPPIDVGGGGAGLRKLAVLYPDGKLLRADGTFQDVSKSPTAGIQELINHASQNFVDAYIVGGVEDGTRGFQKFGSVVYNVNRPIVFPPHQGYRLDTGAITININRGVNPGIRIDSCMMVDLCIRGQIVYNGTGIALDFNPKKLLPLDTFVGPLIVDSSFHITTVVPTNTSATAVRFNGTIVHSNFFFNEINGGRRGIDVTGGFAKNRLICKHLHAQAGKNGLGVRVGSGAAKKNVWEVNIDADTKQFMTTAIDTLGSNSLWTVSITKSNGGIGTGIRIRSSVRNTRFFDLFNDARVPVDDEANHRSNVFY